VWNIPQIVASEVLCLSQDLLPHLKWFNVISCQTYSCIETNAIPRGPSNKLWYKYQAAMSSKVTFQGGQLYNLTKSGTPSHSKYPSLTLSHWKPDNRCNKTITATAHPIWLISSNRTWKSWTRSIANQRRDVFQRFFYPGGRCTASHDPHRIHSESSWVMKSCWCILPQKRYRLCMHAKRSYFDTIQSWLQYLMISRVLFKYVPDHIKTYQDSRQHDLQAARSKVASSHQHTHFGISLWIPTSNG